MFAFVNANVIDGTGAALRKHQRVLVDQDRILAVGSRIGIPEGTRIIDIDGKYLMPGTVGRACASGRSSKRRPGGQRRVPEL